MEQTKTFIVTIGATQLDEEVEAELDNKINEWLKEKDWKIEITQRLFSCSEKELAVIIFYKQEKP